MPINCWVKSGIIQQITEIDIRVLISHKRSANLTRVYSNRQMNFKTYKLADEKY